MSDTPRTTQIFSAYKWGVNDQETFGKVAALETELAAAQAKLDAIEKAVSLPDEPKWIAGLYIDLVKAQSYRELHTHAMHLADENLRLREDAERWISIKNCRAGDWKIGRYELHGKEWIITWIFGDASDAAIDAARKEKK
tara:strand:+ start:397 stop:816 length:420 start_codon:yes stop_codon:yes gene_type:complete